MSKRASLDTRAGTGLRHRFAVLACRGDERVEGFTAALDRLFVAVTMSNRAQHLIGPFWEDDKVGVVFIRPLDHH